MVHLATYGHWNAETFNQRASLAPAGCPWAAWREIAPACTVLWSVFGSEGAEIQQKAGLMLEQKNVSYRLFISRVSYVGKTPFSVLILK